MDHVKSKLATEAAAARSLLQALAETIGDDDDFKSDIVEGETSLHDAIVGAVTRVAEVSAHSEAIAIMMKDLSARKSRFDVSADNLRNSIRSALELATLPKVELPIATVSLRRVPPKVEITEPTHIPEAFLKQPPPVIDKTAIKAALDAGEHVPGAQLSNGSQTVAIKFR